MPQTKVWCYAKHSRLVLNFFKWKLHTQQLVIMFLLLVYQNYTVNVLTLNRIMLAGVRGWGQLRRRFWGRHECRSPSMTSSSLASRRWDQALVQNFALNIHVCPNIQIFVCSTWYNYVSPIGTFDCPPPYPHLSPHLSVTNPVRVSSTCFVRLTTIYRLLSVRYFMFCYSNIVGSVWHLLIVTFEKCCA